MADYRDNDLNRPGTTPGMTTSTTTGTTTGTTGRYETERAKSEAQRTAEQMKTDVRATAEQLKGDAQATAERLKQQASDTLNRAKAEGQSQFKAQKDAVSDQIGGYADVLHHTAEDLEKEQQQNAAHYVHQAASALDDIASSLRRQEFGDIAHQVESFARRQPALFLGGMVAAGFLVGRFLKSSSHHSYGGGYSSDYERDYGRNYSQSSQGYGSDYGYAGSSGYGYGRPPAGETARNATGEPTMSSSGSTGSVTGSTSSSTGTRTATPGASTPNATTPSHTAPTPSSTSPLGSSSTGLGSSPTINPPRGER